MAELATIARPYAEALFQVSRADLAATQSWLDSLAGAAGNDELLQFAANPKVNASQVFHIVTSVLKNPLPERGTSVLVVSHDLPLIKRMKKRVLILDHGKLMDDISPADLAE